MSTVNKILSGVFLPAFVRRGGGGGGGGGRGDDGGDDRPDIRGDMVGFGAAQVRNEAALKKLLVCRTSEAEHRCDVESYFAVTYLDIGVYRRESNSF